MSENSKQKFDKMAYANSVDPDQTAPLGGVMGVYTVCHPTKYFTKQLLKNKI